MSYLLKRITPEDVDYIISSVGGSEEILRAFSRYKEGMFFSGSWVVNKEDNEFFIKFPCTVRPESLDVPYLLFFSGNCYKFYDEGQNGHWYYFDKDYVPAVDQLNEVKEAIKNIFSIYGRWGEGPLDKTGKRKYEVIPHFREVD